jgi:hypothetical protein
LFFATLFNYKKVIPSITLIFFYLFMGCKFETLIYKIAYAAAAATAGVGVVVDQL